MRVVGIGGGTGLPVLLSGLKELNDSGEPIDVTAIVAVSDSGGSTGVLREAFNMPAMGDIRKCMVSLAPEHSVLTSVCEHRFENPDGFAGHAVGNLILSALYQMSGSFTTAVRDGCRILGLKGRVLPATESPVTLCAMYEDGGVTRGESVIPQLGRRISRVWLESPFPDYSASAGVIEALERADAIVLGPGSLYTSIVPNLLVTDIAGAIQASSAIKIYINNLMTQAGETDGYSAADHLQALMEYLPSIDVCVMNSSRIGTGVAKRYSKSGSGIVSGTPEDEDAIRRIGVIPVAAPLLKDGEVKARHDPAMLARLVVSLASGFKGSPELICGERNRR